MRAYVTIKQREKLARLAESGFLSDLEEFFGELTKLCRISNVVAARGGTDAGVTALGIDAMILSQLTN